MAKLPRIPAKMSQPMRDRLYLDRLFSTRHGARRFPAETTAIRRQAIREQVRSTRKGEKPKQSELALLLWLMRAARHDRKTGGFF